MNNPNVCIGLGCLLGAALASTVFALGIGADPISWADAHNGLITAASTTVVATFTVVLAWVTRTQARLTREALITTERAFVFLEDFDHRWIFQPGSLSGASGRMITRPPTFTEFIINLRWKNNGTTPTRNMRVIVGWTATFGPLSADFEYKTDRAPRKMFLAPQANEWSDPIVLPPSVATAALNGTTQVYVWGRVDYDDIFEGTPPHFTSWCYHMRLVVNNVGQPEAQFVAEGDYNRSDEDLRLRISKAREQAHT